MNPKTYDLAALYSMIDEKGREAIVCGEERVDPVLSRMEEDKRKGLTLMIEVTGDAALSIQGLEDELREVEPDQYYYPKEDLHITVLDLISAHDRFRKEENLIARTCEMVADSMNLIKPFDIRFKGVIASDAAILATGWYDGGLCRTRGNIRRTAQARGLDLKERYQSITAHSTITRFKTKLQNRNGLLNVLDRHRNKDMGVVSVHCLDLVIHDWYNNKKELIAQFFLT